MKRGIPVYRKPTSKYFALNAAVASEAYDGTLFNTATNNPLVHSEWIEYRTESWSACWHPLFPLGDDRKKLTWSNRFVDVAVKTQLYNYYSSGDEVLEIGDQGICLLEDGFNFRQSSWQKQEVFKGRNIIYGTGWAGWGFETNVAATVVASLKRNRRLRKKMTERITKSSIGIPRAGAPSSEKEEALHKIRNHRKILKGCSKNRYLLWEVRSGTFWPLLTESLGRSSLT